MPDFAKNRPPLVAIFLLSALTLSYEILLTRLLSIVQWHHFAYMIISIALLGYGVSGAFITIFQKKLQQHFSLVFMINIVCFAISSIGSFIFIQQLPFNPLEIFWDKTQWIWLLLIYVLLILPFFFAANGIGLVFTIYRRHINASYAADLLGASSGALGIIGLLYYLFPVTTLQAIVCAAGLAAFIAALELKLKKPAAVICLLIIIFPWLLPQSSLELKPSEYKSLSQTLNIIGTRVLQEKADPMAVITVVESPIIPFHYAPGLSLASTSAPPEQLGIFYDGDNMSTITRFSGPVESHAYLDNMTSALPYQLRKNPEVLVLGAGGGADVLQARYYHAKNIDAVELNQQVVDLVKNDYADFSGGIYTHDKINLKIAEARSFIQASDKQYDIIQMALMDSFAASAAGLYSLNESYLYTTEALRLYLSHLKPDGILAVTRWITLPPRDILKLIATAKQALLDSGVTDSGQHIALIRSWNTATLIIKKTPLNQNNIRSIIDYSRTRSFDLAYYPGITAKETNQFNILPEAYFYQGASALLSAKSDEFIRHYKYNLQPATDDKPYFFNFLKWQTLPEILQLPANQGMALIEWGTIILIATLVQAIVASMVLILLPLWIHQRHSVVNTQVKAIRFVFSYFTLLGIAFMFVEMAFIQRLVLFLGHPTYAISVALSGFLFFAGTGSGISSRWSSITSVKVATFGIILIAALYLLLLPDIFAWCVDFTDFSKIMISLLLIAPLSFFMGMPFPQGLRFLGSYSPEHIPWAWGVNGCASVISAIAATLLAMQFGFIFVVLIALASYGLAGYLFLRKISEAS